MNQPEDLELFDDHIVTDESTGTIESINRLQYS